MTRKVGSVVVVVALTVLAGIALPVGGAPTASLGGDAPSSTVAASVVAPQADGNATNGTGGATAEGGTDSTTNASLGAQLSSFMSASAADVESDVETGTFRAKWDRSEDSQRARLIRQRTDEIETRIEELREERQELLAVEEPTSRERARAAWLAVQARSLAKSVGQMSEAADRANVKVDQAKLDDLRQNASNLSDGEIEELATDVADGRRGPPDDAGPPGDGERGPPDDAGRADGERGSNERSENGTDDGASGSGNDGPPGKSDSGDDDDDEKDEKEKEKDGKGGGSGAGSGSGNENGPGGSDNSGGDGRDEGSGQDGGSGNDGPPGKDGGEGDSDSEGSDGRSGNGNSSDGSGGSDDTGAN